MAAVKVPDSSEQRNVSHWVSLHWDRFTIALPQHEITAIELSADLREPLPHEREVGWFPTSSLPAPVYRFDDRLRITRGLRRDGFVILMNDSDPWGLWGEAVNVLSGEETPRGVKLPAIFARTPGPVTGLAVGLDGKPILQCSAQSLFAWVKEGRGRRTL